MNRGRLVAAVCGSTILALAVLTAALASDDVPYWAIVLVPFLILLALGFLPFAVTYVLQLRRPDRQLSKPVVNGVGLVLGLMAALGGSSVIAGSRTLGAIGTLLWWVWMAHIGASLARWVRPVRPAIVEEA